MITGKRNLVRAIRPNGSEVWISKGAAKAQAARGELCFDGTDNVYRWPRLEPWRIRDRALLSIQYDL